VIRRRPYSTVECERTMQHGGTRSRSEEAMIVVEEVLSRPGENDKPIAEQEYWTLGIVDWTESWRPGFAVQQARAFWSEIDRQFMCTELETELYPLLIDAEERYETRRLALLKMVFLVMQL